ncbi:MAG: hypothetical protein JXA03_08250 [Bacteroidales bacterium]|nr:hypothetical protein [Bacteroidales bacterium]
MKKAKLLIAALMLFAVGAMAQNPILHWRFANPIVYDNAGVCTLEFDVELSCDMANTYHSDLQVYFDYNTLAFGENVVTNGVLSYTRLPLLQGDLAGTPLYAIYGNVDNKPYRYAILSEATFTVPNPMFMNAVPMLPAFGGYMKVSMIIADENQVAGIEFVAEDGGVGLMNGGQYYLDATHPAATKYGDPPDYAGVYENDLLTLSLSCGIVPTDNVWTNGAMDDDWFNPLNWSLGVVPTNVQNVTIPDLGKAACVDISGGVATAGTLTVNVGACLTILEDGALTVIGLTTVDGALVMETNMTLLSPSFVDEGLAGTGTFVFNRYLVSGATGTNAGWHLISSPVNNTVSGDFAGYWVNAWDEPTALYYPIDPYPGPTPCDGTSFGNISMSTMQGYAVKRFVDYPLVGACLNWIPPVWSMHGLGADVISFGGDPFNGFPNIDNWFANATNVADITLVNTGTFAANVDNTGDGWNLLGNPYPSYIIAANFVATLPVGVDGSIYYYDNAAETYQVYAGGIGADHIPPTQGFFVKANTAGPHFVSLDNTMRGHSNVPFYKEEVSNLLVLEATGNGYADKTYVRFLDEATSGFDRMWDAHKLLSEAEGVPQIYTTGTGQNYAINAVESAKSVPMSFTAIGSGVYSIAIDENDLGTIILQDLKTGILHNLETNYEFSYVEGENADRFVIHFGEVSLDNATNGILVYSNENKVFVYNTNNLQGEIAIFGMMGQQVTTAKLEGGLNMITLNDMNNYYVVKVLTESTVVSEKVYIR